MKKSHREHLARELEYGELIQYGTEEPYYEWKVRKQGDQDYLILRFNDESEIIKQDHVLRLCFRKLHVLPVKLKTTEWTKIVNAALADMETREIELEHEK